MILWGSKLVCSKICRNATGWLSADNHLSLCLEPGHWNRALRNSASRTEAMKTALLLLVLLLLLTAVAIVGSASEVAHPRRYEHQSCVRVGESSAAAAPRPLSYLRAAMSSRNPVGRPPKRLTRSTPQVKLRGAPICSCRKTSCTREDCGPHHPPKEDLIKLPGCGSVDSLHKSGVDLSKVCWWAGKAPALPWHRLAVAVCMPRLTKTHYTHTGVGTWAVCRLTRGLLPRSSHPQLQRWCETRYAPCAGTSATPSSCRVPILSVA